MRASIETEALYAAEFPFVDYGSDLAIMAEMEKGVKLQKLATTDTDVKENKDSHAVEEYLGNMKPRKYDKIPLDFVGKGPRGYILYDMVHHRKKGAPAVSQDFKDVVRRFNTSEENRISK